MSKVGGIIDMGWRLVLAGLFLWSGGAKLISPLAFAEGVRAFHAFPEMMVNLIVMTVPVIELMAAAMLLVPRWGRAGALLTALLSFGFLLLFAWALWHGNDVKCSCFGGSEMTEGSSVMGLGRAVAIFGVSVFLYARRLGRG